MDGTSKETLSFEELIGLDLEELVGEFAAQVTKVLESHQAAIRSNTKAIRVLGELLDRDA